MRNKAFHWPKTSLGIAQWIKANILAMRTADLTAGTRVLAIRCDAN